MLLHPKCDVLLATVYFSLKWLLFLWCCVSALHIPVQGLQGFTVGKLKNQNSAVRSNEFHLWPEAWVVGQQVTNECHECLRSINVVIRRTTIV